MRKILFATIATSVLAGSVAAQAPTRKPGPEQERIGYFAGRWTYEGEVKDSPMGPGGKIKSSETCEWFAGGFHLVCRSAGTGPMGTGTGQSATGYDPIEKTYTYHSISSLGDAFFVRGHVRGPVWSWSNQSTIDGKLLKSRVTVTEQSPSAFTFRMEFSADGGPWQVVEEGKGTRVNR